MTTSLDKHRQAPKYEVRQTPGGLLGHTDQLHLGLVGRIRQEAGVSGIDGAGALLAPS